MPNLASDRMYNEWHDTVLLLVYHHKMTHKAVVALLEPSLNLGIVRAVLARFRSEVDEADRESYIAELVERVRGSR